MKTLDLHNLTKIYGEGENKVVAVDNIDLEVRKGEIILIMGPSGSGKTTLLSMAGGLLKPTTGEIFVKNIEITKLNEEKLPEIRLANIGFIFQSFNLLSALTALENVALVIELTGAKSEQARKKAGEILKQLGLEKRMNFLPEKLSGGEKQRVSVARALANEAEIILADEPTANLDSKHGHEVMMQLTKITKEHGKSVVIVSHDNRIKDIADRILWLEDGKFKELAKMEIDPACGMSIERGEIKYIFKNKEYYFCSKGCKKEFKEKVFRSQINSLS